MTFEKLGLRAELVRAVCEKGYVTPTPIQRQAIPPILQGRDLMGSAQTGTGKTAGFTLPLLQRLAAAPKPQPGRRVIRALVITPTRELAAQVADSVDAYSKWLPLSAAVVFGGVGINPQKQRLMRGVDILVATPGRLLDHVGQGSVDLSGIELLVLDEADRMLDMGFIHDIRKLLALLPQKKQTLLFSATFSDEIRQLANGLLKSPALVEVAKRNTSVEAISQVVHPVDKSRKRELLSWLIGANRWQQVLIFCRTRHGANRLAQQLGKDGIDAAAIHGNKSQGARTRALADFKAGRLQALVATDIAARGLDIDQLPHVVNYELPNVAEDYVHRIGRTGRAGREGEAISLVSVDEMKLLQSIERLIRRDIPRRIVEGYRPDPSIRPAAEAQGAAREQGKSARRKPARGRTRRKSGHGKRTGSGRRAAA